MKIDGMDYDLSIHTNPDAMAWATFFRECNQNCNVPDDLMFGWFANAMMAMHDHLLGGPVVLPDGSACFVAEVGRTETALEQPNAAEPEVNINGA